MSGPNRAKKPEGLATVIDGPNIGEMLLVTPVNAAQGTLGNAELDRVVARDTQGELEAGRTSVRHYGPQGQTTPEDLVNTPTVRVFIDAFSPPPTMVIFGAVDFTSALARVAKVLGYHVLVCDACEVFASKRRLPMADEVRVTWQGPLFVARRAQITLRYAVHLLTNAPQFDVPSVCG